MKLDIDTSKWFSDKTRVAIVIIWVLTVFNTIALIILLWRGCCGKWRMPEMPMWDCWFEQMMDWKDSNHQMPEMPMWWHR